MSRLLLRRTARTVASRRAAFTLLELMISVSIFAIVVAAVFESLTQQHKTSIVTENVVEAQNNVRAIASLMEREIRMAGYMVPDAVGVCGLDSTTSGDELFVSENEPIVPDDARAGDMGARLAAGAGAWSNPAINTSAPASSSAITLSISATTSDLDDDGTLFYDNDNNGTTDADFRVGGGFILADKANPQRGTLCGTVNAASTTQLVLVPMAGGLDTIGGSDAEEEIVIVPAAHYAIERDASGAETGRLLRNGDLLAQGVDDFQVSYFFDVDDDGVVDATADVTGDGVVDAGYTEEPATKDGASYDPAVWNNGTLKEVRFSIIVRTRATDLNFDDGNFVVKENRTAPAVGSDGFRRRVVVGAVRPRNIGNAGSI